LPQPLSGLSLQLRAVKTQICHLRLRDGLDDEVNVNRTSSGMRPKAVIDLISRNEPPEFSRLLHGQICHGGDVALGLDDQCPNTERSDAVLDEPKSGLVDKATRQFTVASG
jgi:hypothetical protein